MNFNHLIPKHEMMRECSGGKHSYYPSGHIEAMIGGTIAIRFRCKKCGEVVTSFLEAKDFEIHRNVIENYIESKGA